MNRHMLAAVSVVATMAVAAPTFALTNTGYKWPQASGKVDVVKGKVDRWAANGVLETGGFLGLGNTHLKVIPQTVIVDAQGKRLTESALRPGLQIASIYKTSAVTSPQPSGTATDGGENKIALVIILATNKK